MPFGDRTGPEGKGPMTGRRAGDCSGDDSGNRIVAQGWGFGRGRGAGRGFGRGGGGWGRGRGFFAPPVTISPEQEVNELEAQAQSLQGTLQHIKDRLEKLKG